MSTNTLASWCSLKKKTQKNKKTEIVEMGESPFLDSFWMIPGPDCISRAHSVSSRTDLCKDFFFFIFFLEKEIIHLPPTLFSLPSVPVCPISTHCTLSVGGSHNPRGPGDPGNRSQPVWTSGSWQQPRKQERSTLNAFPVGAVNHVILRWMEFSCSFK